MLLVLTISEDKIPAFKEAFKQSVRDSISAEDLIPKLNIDGKITLDMITERFFKILGHFSPFGPQNSRPVFVAEGVEVINGPQIVGKNHVRFMVKQNGVKMPVIGFNHGDKLHSIQSNKTFSFSCVSLSKKIIGREIIICNYN